MAAGGPVRQPANCTKIMMRSILIAAVMGVLAAVPASYFLTAPARQDRTATSARAGNAGSATVAPAEAWPICSTMAAMAETPDWAALDPDFAAGKRAIGAGDWEGAIKALTNAGLRDARNADIQNYLGYAYRRLRQFGPAMRHYQQALTLNPRQARAALLLDRVYEIFPKLKERRSQRAGTMSGGERQMLAVGRALMSGPKLLMLDEPSLGLAPAVVESMYETFGRLHREGLTILLAEQSIELALEVSDFATVLQVGRSVLSGTASALAEDPQVQKAYLGTE